MARVPARRQDRESEDIYPKTDWKKVFLIAVVTWMILMLLVSCKQKSSAERQPQESNTTQKQAEKAVEEDL